MINKGLIKACRIAIIDCMAVRKKERILVVTDEKKYNIGNALHLTALELGFNSILVQIKSGITNGEEPPVLVSELMRQFDVIFCPTTKSLTHTDARRNACAAGARIATFPGITEEVMIRGLGADYNKIAQRSNKLKKLFEKTRIIHVLTNSGTDIKLDVTGRKAIASHGLFQ